MKINTEMMEVSLFFSNGKNVERNTTTDGLLQIHFSSNSLNFSEYDRTSQKIRKCVQFWSIESGAGKNLKMEPFRDKCFSVQNS